MHYHEAPVTSGAVSQRSPRQELQPSCPSPAASTTTASVTAFLSPVHGGVLVHGLDRLHLPWLLSGAMDKWDRWHHDQYSSIARTDGASADHRRTPHHQASNPRKTHLETRHKVDVLCHCVNAVLHPLVHVWQSLWMVMVRLLLVLSQAVVV